MTTCRNCGDTGWLVEPSGAGVGLRCSCAIPPEVLARAKDIGDASKWISLSDYVASLPPERREALERERTNMRTISAQFSMRTYYPVVVTIPPNVHTLEKNGEIFVIDGGGALLSLQVAAERGIVAARCLVRQ